MPTQLEEFLMPASLLSDLSHLSEQLNKESAKINETIRRVNESLASMNFGVPVWLDSPFLEGENQKAVQLGYVNVENKWQLAVRVVQPKEGEQGARENGASQALLKANRSLRIEAMGLLPRLNEAIKDRVQALICSIQKAQEAHAHIVLEEEALANNLNMP